jgi:hypothetical protein
MVTGTKKGELALKPFEAKKVDVELTGGIARAVARVEVIEAELMMDYILDGVQLKAGDKALLKGEAAFQKLSLYRYGDVMFVLCPEAYVFGYRKAE